MFADIADLKTSSIFSCFLPVLGMDTQNPFPYKALRFGSYDLP